MIDFFSMCQIHRCSYVSTFAISLMTVTLSAVAACPDDAAIDTYVKEFSQQKLSKGFGNDISLDDAECAKRKLAKKLIVPLGAIMGYKAAFTNPALQKSVLVSMARNRAICINAI